jgi:transcriptional regulator with GAF, ATPase, and Fis domain
VIAKSARAILVGGDAELTELLRALFATGFTLANVPDIEQAVAELRRQPAELIVVASGAPRSDSSTLARTFRAPTGPIVLIADRFAAVAPASAPAEQARTELVGQSPLLRHAIAQACLVAPTDASVLITGESGSGKELIARTIHEHSRRQHRPVVSVNCACVPRDLFESEFFGHVRGAFTSAVRDRLGRFHLADEGTILLDEVAEIPLELQGKLLRVLEGGHVQRVGEDRIRLVNVRVIAATNRDLAKEVEAGRFRRDVYYRLCVFPIHVPPLRERREDIPLLARHFLARAARRLHQPEYHLTPENLDLLQRHDWPGNVRELLNVMERAAILGALTLPTAAPPNGMAPSPADGTPVRMLTQLELKERERGNMLAALQQSDWKLYGPGGAAELLGVRPTTLASRLRRFGIERRHRRGRVWSAGHEPS